MIRAARRLLALLTLVSLGVLWPAGAASAHPLGNFTVNLYSGIHVVPGEIRIDYVVDMAEIPTFQEMPSIDTDGDGTVSTAEGASWAAERAPRLAANLTLTVDGDPVALEVRSADARVRDGQGGLSILRFEGLFAAGVEREGRIAYRDDNEADTIGWREITATGEDGEAIEGSTVPAESVSDALLSYPQDLLSSPLHVTSMQASFAPGVLVGATSERGSRSTRPAQASTSGRSPRSWTTTASCWSSSGSLWPWRSAPGTLLLPGHGKTLMAAYMVGSQTKVRQAVAVGSAVAVMHTASVLGLGLLVITLEQTFRPESLYPWLGLLSGVVAIGLGAYLTIGRLTAWSRSHAAEASDTNMITGRSTTMRTSTPATATACRKASRSRRSAGCSRSPWPEASCRRRAR